MIKQGKTWWPVTWQGLPEALENIPTTASATYLAGKTTNTWTVEAGDQIRTIIGRDFGNSQAVVSVTVNGYTVTKLYRVQPGDNIVFYRSRPV